MEIRTAGGAWRRVAERKAAFGFNAEAPSRLEICRVVGPDGVERRIAALNALYALILADLDTPGGDAINSLDFRAVGPDGAPLPPPEPGGVEGGRRAPLPYAGISSGSPPARGVRCPTCASHSPDAPPGAPDLLVGLSDGSVAALSVLAQLDAGSGPGLAAARAPPRAARAPSLGSDGFDALGLPPPRSLSMTAASLGPPAPRSLSEGGALQRSPSLTNASLPSGPLLGGRTGGAVFVLPPRSRGPLDPPAPRVAGVAWVPAHGASLFAVAHEDGRVALHHLLLGSSSDLRLLTRSGSLSVPRLPPVLLAREVDSAGPSRLWSDSDRRGQGDAGAGGETGPAGDARGGAATAARAAAPGDAPLGGASAGAGWLAGFGGGVSAPGGRGAADLGGANAGAGWLAGYGGGGVSAASRGGVPISPPHGRARAAPDTRGDAAPISPRRPPFGRADPPALRSQSPAGSRPTSPKSGDERPEAAGGGRRPVDGGGGRQRPADGFGQPSPWDVYTSPAPPPTGVTAVAPSPDGELVAAAGRDGTVRVWLTGRKRPASRGGPVRDTGGAFAEAFGGGVGGGGGLAATAASGGGGPGAAVPPAGAAAPSSTTLAGSVGPAPPPPTKGFRTWFGGVLALAWSPDSSLLAAGGEDDLVYVFSLRAGRVVAVGIGHSSWVSALAFDPWGCGPIADGKAGEAELDRRRGARGPPAATAASYRLASAGQDCTVIFWDIVAPDDGGDGGGYDEEPLDMRGHVISRSPSNLGLPGSAAPAVAPLPAAAVDAGPGEPGPPPSGPTVAPGVEELEGVASATPAGPPADPVGGAARPPPAKALAALRIAPPPHLAGGPATPLGFAQGMTPKGFGGTTPPATPPLGAPVERPRSSPPPAPLAPDPSTSPAPFAPDPSLPPPRMRSRAAPRALPAWPKGVVPRVPRADLPLIQPAARATVGALPLCSVSFCEAGLVAVSFGGGAACFSRPPRP